MKFIFAAAVLLASGSALAAPPVVSTSTPTASSTDLDPQRLALAKQAVEAIIAPGTMQRVMKESMTGVQQSMMSRMFDMKGADMGVTGKDKDKTLREVMLEKDPYFEERMKITNQVMYEEMGALFSKMEPGLKEGMARAYARRFSVAELTDINRFFGSTSGASFARQSFELMTDPELTQEMMSIMPELMKQMPAIMEKVKKATAHLPPPPKDEDEDEGKKDAAQPAR